MDTWLLTIRNDCDLPALAEALAALDVNLDTARKPMPLDRNEQVIVVKCAVALPPAVAKLPGVIKVSPASRLYRT